MLELCLQHPWHFFWPKTLEHWCNLAAHVLCRNKYQSSVGTLFDKHFLFKHIRALLAPLLTHFSVRLSSKAKRKRLKRCFNLQSEKMSNSAYWLRGHLPAACLQPNQAESLCFQTSTNSHLWGGLKISHTQDMVIITQAISLKKNWISWSC